MALLFMPALFFGAIAIALLGLAIICVALMIVLKVLSAILWVAIKITEHWSAIEPEIIIVIEDDPCPMRDVTPRDLTRQLKATAQRVR